MEIWTKPGEISPDSTSSHQIWQPNSSAWQKPKTRKRVRVESGFERRCGGGDRRDVWRWRSPDVRVLQLQEGVRLRARGGEAVRLRVRGGEAVR